MFEELVKIVLECDCFEYAKNKEDIKRMLEDSEPFEGSFETLFDKTNMLLFVDSYWNEIVAILIKKSSPYLGDYDSIQDIFTELWRIKVKENKKMVDVIADKVLEK